AKAASALNHPNIITIHEIDETDTGHFMATEFIDGETLRERMRSAPMKLTEVLDVAAQIASALSAAHAAGIIHRDIKPENVMLRRDGIVKVLDFGLAKLSERTLPELVDTEAPTRAAIKTEPGVVMGTAIYMSPEQARGLPVDARTDIFSLGVLIYEMVAGRLPFEGSNTNEIVASILSDKEPPPLARYARDVPAELERIVSKALRKDREERYHTSKDPNTEYLSDGITDSLINSLSQLPNMRMIAHGSVSHYKGREADPQEVARELNVQAIVMGRITQLGDNLSISAELVDARTNSRLWGEQYNRNPTDILKVQTEIAREISERLRVKLTGEQQNRMTKRYTDNTEAYLLYTK